MRGRGRSRFATEARDPWGLLLGAAAGALAWGLGGSPPLGLLMAAATWLLRIVLALLEDGPGSVGGTRATPAGREPPTLPAASRRYRHANPTPLPAWLRPWLGGGRRAQAAGAPPPARLRSEEVAWLARARQAAATLGGEASRVQDPLLREPLGAMGLELAATVRALERLASQASVARYALTHGDPSLEHRREHLLACMRDGALSLEGASARLRELAALTEPRARVAAVASLTAALREVQHELARAEQDSRRAIDAWRRRRGDALPSFPTRQGP